MCVYEVYTVVHYFEMSFGVFVVDITIIYMGFLAVSGLLNYGKPSLLGHFSIYFCSVNCVLLLNLLTFHMDMIGSV